METYLHKTNNEPTVKQLASSHVAASDVDGSSCCAEVEITSAAAGDEDAGRSEKSQAEVESRRILFKDFSSVTFICWWYRVHLLFFLETLMHEDVSVIEVSNVARTLTYLIPCLAYVLTLVSSENRWTSLIHVLGHVMGPLILWRRFMSYSRSMYSPAISSPWLFTYWRPTIRRMHDLVQTLYAVSGMMLLL